MSISGIDGTESAQSYIDSVPNVPEESKISPNSQDADFIDSLMISKDTDGDGILDLDESGLRKKKFDKYDIDGNGKISADEVQAEIERIQKQKSELGKLDVHMQQAEHFAANVQKNNSQSLLGFEESGLDEDTFNMLDSDGDGKVSQADINAATASETEDQGLSGDKTFSEAVEEYDKRFFSRKKDDEEDNDLNNDLNNDGTVTEEELRQSEKTAGIKAEQNKDSEESEKMKGPSARHMAGVRAYQEQAAGFFASAAQSTVEFEY